MQRHEKIKLKLLTSTNSEIDPTVGAMFDAMQKQSEILSQQIKMLTLRMDKALARTPMGNISEASSLITVDEITHHR